MGERSFLFVPGIDEKKIAKAMQSSADVIVLDLEDSVIPAQKEMARANVARIITEGSNKPMLVRINSVSTPWALLDLLAVIPQKPYGIMLPKSEKASDVEKVSWISEQLGGADSELRIYPLIESAAGVERALEIAQASRRIHRLVFGALDYLLDLGLDYNSDPSLLAYPRARLVGISAMTGLEGPVDTVFPLINDEEGLQRDTLEAKTMGFTGKLIIHPLQIEIVNGLFTPSSTQIEEARQIVEVYKEAQLAGKGAIQWKGKMLDEPVLKRAQRVLEQVFKNA